LFYPKIVYENLPYLYFIVSGYLLAFYDSWAVILSATLFYCAGCIILVTRSDHRRVDRHKHAKHHLKHVIPEMIYEYIPYLYFAIAVLILRTTNQAWLQFLATTLIIFAFRNLLFRKNNRRKEKSLF
jgi:L-asparagine transporter-like permease